MAHQISSLSSHGGGGGAGCGGGEGDGGDGDGDEGGGVGGGEGGVDLQMHFWDEEHEPVLPAPKTRSQRDEANWQPGGTDVYVPDV